MGLIILPLIGAWLAGFIYSGFMWHSILTGDKPVLYAVAVLALGVLLVFAYVFVGFLGFKSRESVWAFEIPMFFLLNKLPIMVFALAAVCYCFGWASSAFPHITAVCFVLCFATSGGALVGSLYAGTYVQKHEIDVTY